MGKREIARAFQLDSEQKVMLKVVLKAMADEGLIDKGRGKRFAEPGTLPSVGIIIVTAIDEDGEAEARPANWNEAEAGPPPRIDLKPGGRGPAFGIGDRVLAHLDRTGDRYSARAIRRLDSAPASILGIYRAPPENPTGRGRSNPGRLEPTEKKAKSELVVEPEDAGEASDGDLVRAEILPQKRHGLRRARVIEVIDNLDDPRTVSLIAIHEQGIPIEFSDAVVEEAEACGPAPLGKRDDLRDVPLVTIDGADARDFDDAVFAEPDPDPNNEGGYHLIVAIADVSWYVREGSPLDREAYKRGNSTYLPDRVVPMLPEALSNGWCSLVPKEDRPCLAAHLWVDRSGRLKRHRFVRGLMRSAARLTYEQAQAARDGDVDDTTDVLIKPVIEPLYAAFELLWQARTSRGVLELDVPERRVVIGEDGRVADIVTRQRLDSHKLIEEFMILANVAAAEALEKKHQPCMYRIHDEPSLEKREVLRQVLETIGVNLAKAQVFRPATFNQVLERVRGTPHEPMINELVLRTQAQAVYSPDNIGHFGLNLPRYAHFTSPIRRYSDLLVHRALVRGYGLGEGGLEADQRDFVEAGEHISTTERRSAMAERNAVDRFTALHLAEKVGAILEGRITGVQRFGLFVQLDGTGGDGMVPVASLGDDYYVHDEDHQALIGQSTRKTYQLGDAVSVLLVEANPVSGGLLLNILDEGGEPISSQGRFRRRGGPGHKGKGRKFGSRPGNKRGNRGGRR